MEEHTSEVLEQLPPSNEQTALVSTAGGCAATIWNDTKQMNAAWRTATMLSKSLLLPQETYFGKPENVIICMDIANRMNVSPLLVAQNLYVVKGRPAWSGSFCVAAINGCGKFTPLEFIFTEEDGGGCTARAKRLSNGAVCQSETITMRMAADEGWSTKPGSKWKTMPRQMMMYRAASFFARAHCPEVLLGIQTQDEVKDTLGYDEAEKPTVTITLD